MTSTRTIILVGYMSNLFDIPLLTVYWPNNCGWKIYNNTLISSDGARVIWMDAYKFSCGLSLQDYCYHWGSKTREPTIRFNKNQMLNAILNRWSKNLWHP